MEEEEDRAALFEEPDGFRPPSPPPAHVTVARVRTGGNDSSSSSREGDGDGDGGKDRNGGVDAFKIRLVRQHSLWAHCLWNAGVVLAQHIDAHPEIVRGKRVLELGAAAAVPSMVAALNGATKVVVTDYPDPQLVENMVFNIDNNLPGARASGRVAVLGYLWGQPVAPLLAALRGADPGTADAPADGTGAASNDSSGRDAGAFDVIILADVVFNHSQHHHLLQACAACLAPNSDAEVYVPFTPHRPWLYARDLDFFRLAAEAPYNFVVDQPFQVRTGPMFPNDPGDEELRSTVFGYRLRRRGPVHSSTV